MKIAVQNPLTSFADDVATTRRVIDAQGGPVVAVGHSYGGGLPLLHLPWSRQPAGELRS